MGSVMHLAQFPEGDHDLSYALVAILCNKVDQINEKVVLKWQGQSFSVLVEEECSEWIPDCIGAMEEDDGRESAEYQVVEEHNEDDGNRTVNGVAMCHGVSFQPPCGVPKSPVTSQSIPLLCVGHWFRPALDSSGERRQLSTSGVFVVCTTRHVHLFIDTDSVPQQSPGLASNPKVQAQPTALRPSNIWPVTYG
ncbi:hypothetical protein Hanom_Chr13g01231161 [Helianthus anomalus]